MGQLKQKVEEQGVKDTDEVTMDASPIFHDCDVIGIYFYKHVLGTLWSIEPQTKEREYLDIGR